MLKKKERILLYGSNIWYLGEGMLVPLFAVFAEKVGGDILEITWAWAIYLFVTGLLVMLIGKISDNKISKKKLMVAGYALNAIFTFGYLFVSSTWHLFIVQAGLGMAVALAAPTWESLYAQYEDKKHAGYTWGLADGESRLFTALAIVIGGLIVTFFSFRALFLVMGVIQVIATIYQTQLLKK